MINILLVDDNDHKVEKIQTAIRDGLLSEKIKTKPVKTIADASRAIGKNNFDLMILDLNLPMRKGSSPIPDAGLKFLYQLKRRSELNKPIHIIGLTAIDELFKKHAKDFEQEGWILLKYEDSSNNWGKILLEKIHHIVDTTKKIRTAQALASGKKPWYKLKLFYGAIVGILALVAYLLAISDSGTFRKILSHFKVHSVATPDTQTDSNLIIDQPQTISGSLSSKPNQDTNSQNVPSASSGQAK